MTLSARASDHRRVVRVLVRIDTADHVRNGMRTNLCIDGCFDVHLECCHSGPAFRFDDWAVGSRPGGTDRSVTGLLVQAPIRSRPSGRRTQQHHTGPVDRSDGRHHGQTMNWVRPARCSTTPILTDHDAVGASSDQDAVGAQRSTRRDVGVYLVNGTSLCPQPLDTKRCRFSEVPRVSGKAVAVKACAPRERQTTAGGRAYLGESAPAIMRSRWLTGSSTIRPPID